MNKSIRIAAAAALAIGLALFASNNARAQSLQVTRATLSNGLKVIVVRDPLAPVVTTMLDYLAGGNQQQFPGEAHALEHMSFRGTPDISSTQLFEIGQLMGGFYDADTQSEVTQYFWVAPTQYLDVALRLDADRAKHLTLSQKDWLAESGAIKQEVVQDDSIPWDKLFIRTILPDMYKGTPYANDVLGTLHGFNNVINARILRRYYQTWYKPNNAVLIITGDVDGSEAVSKVRKYFGSLPAGKLPAQAAVHLQPFKPASYHVASDKPYTQVALVWRSPGWSDKDYAAFQVMEDVLNNQRSDLYGLVASGKSFAADITDEDTHAHATSTAVESYVPVTTTPQAALADLRGVLNHYLQSGLPADLVEVAKQREVTQAESRGNSVSGLAFEWSQAVVQGEQSPDQMIDAIKNVTPQDVNAAFRKYVHPDAAIVAEAVPENNGKVAAGASAPAQENNTITPSKSQPIPAWAQAYFAHPQVPRQTISPVEMTLSNGMRLIVQTEHVSNTIEVHGEIQTNEMIQAPADKQGVAQIAQQLFPFGTATYDRIGLRRQLDQISAQMDAGTSFSLSVLSNNFDQGMQLLADDELHPAFPAQAFEIIKRQAVGALTGETNAPDHLATVALNKALYPPDDPMQRFATPQTAAGITLDDVRAFYEKAYRPDLTTVVVIGDITPDVARAAFEKYFGGWAAQGPKPDIALPAVPKNAAGSSIVPDTGRVQSQVQLVQVLDLKRSDPQWADVQLGNTVLGGGAFGNILMDDLRTQHGYVYDARSELTSHKNRAEFTISYECDPDKINPAQSLALQDLRSVQAGKIDPSRVLRSQSQLISDLPLREASFGGVASELLRYANLDLPLNQATIDAQRELDATLQSVSGAMTKFIDPTAFVRIVTGPGPK